MLRKELEGFNDTYINSFINHLNEHLNDSKLSYIEYMLNDISFLIGAMKGKNNVVYSDGTSVKIPEVFKTETINTNKGIIKTLEDAEKAIATLLWKEIIITLNFDSE
jgi:hypothetical protein